MLTKEEQQELLLLLEERQSRYNYNQFDYMFNRENLFAPNGYVKHRKFLAAGKTNNTRVLFGGNRTGKTSILLYELTTHARGIYPEWWEGYKFDRPVRILCMGRAHEQVRDGVQYALVGEIDNMGTGIIPRKDFWDPEEGFDTKSKSGVAGGLSKIYVKYRNSKTVKSSITFGAAEQDFKNLVGIKWDIIVIDEEPPMLHFAELNMRRLMTGTYTSKSEPGLMMVSITPELGMTEFTQKLIPDGCMPDNNLTSDGTYVDVIAMKDAPHITQDIIDHALRTLPRWLIRPKVYGLPEIGAGAVYPIPAEVYTCEYFKIPEDWPRTFALDPGWKNTAIVWAAMDPNTGIIYIYDEWLQYEYDDFSNITSPAQVPASIIRNRGEWMIGVSDPAGGKHGGAVNQSFLELYQKEGINLRLANNSVDYGIEKLYGQLSTGMFKIFDTCKKTLNQIRMYRMDENQKIIKHNDHLCDVCRYVCVEAPSCFYVNPYYEDIYEDDLAMSNSGANRVTGY